MPTDVDGFYSIQDKRIVLSEACDIMVKTGDAEDDYELVWGDRWEHLDGLTLVIFRNGSPLRTYAAGEWRSCWRTDPAVSEVWL